MAVLTAAIAAILLCGTNAMHTSKEKPTHMSVSKGVTSYSQWLSAPVPSLKSKLLDGFAAAAAPNDQPAQSNGAETLPVEAPKPPEDSKSDEKSVEAKPEDRALKPPEEDKSKGQKETTALQSTAEDKPSCAVVFSSGEMLKREDGPEIDSKDFVIRQNMAPTQGFERHVGSKTTHQILHAGSDKNFYDSKDRDVLGIIAPVTKYETSSFDKMKARADKSGHKMELGEHSSDECSAFFGLEKQADGTFPCEKAMTEARGHEGCLCSGGAYSVMWAMKHCSAVTIYGMSKGPTGETGKWHYFDNEESQRPKDSTWHNFDLEKEKMRNWVEEPEGSPTPGTVLAIKSYETSFIINAIQ